MIKQQTDQTRKKMQYCRSVISILGFFNVPQVILPFPHGMSDLIRGTMSQFMRDGIADHSPLMRGENHFSGSRLGALKERPSIFCYKIHCISEYVSMYHNSLCHLQCHIHWPTDIRGTRKVQKY